MKKDMPFSNKSEVAYEILSYLSEHPDAQDTLDGIAHWWLMERRIKYHISLVREALEELVGRGLIVEKYGTDLSVHFRLNDINLKVIHTYLKDNEKHLLQGIRNRI